MRVRLSPNGRLVFTSPELGFGDRGATGAMLALYLVWSASEIYRKEVNVRRGTSIAVCVHLRGQRLRLVTETPRTRLEPGVPGVVQPDPRTAFPFWLIRVRDGRSSSLLTRLGNQWRWAYARVDAAR